MTTPSIFDADALLGAIEQAVERAVQKALAPTPPAAPVSDWLKCDEAARYVRLSRVRLETLRRVGGGPDFERYGRRVRYRREALDLWIQQRATRHAGRYTG